jgi:diketogulonate reductase-like aldo/keto reductase
MTMELKELGKTGVMLPEIGLGTAGYTGGVEPLRRGISLGAFHVDTAEIYETEDAVGEAISGIRDQVFLATKVHPSHFRRDQVMEAAEGSLRRLRTDRIDLYLLHSANPEVPIEETMGAMDRLVEDGKVRFVGVSNFSVAELQEAQAVSRTRIVTNQVNYSLIVREIEPDLLPYCQRNDITVTAYSPLAAGLDKIRSKLGGALASVAKASGKTEAQVAINWCTAKDGVIAIPRSSSLERTVENCGASGWRLSAEQLAELNAAA